VDYSADGSSTFLRCVGTYIYTLLVYTVDRDSVVSIRTRDGVDGSGIESRWGRDFPQPTIPALGPTPGRGVDHQSTSSAEVKTE
jgi:hypothetical protein